VCEAVIAAQGKLHRRQVVTKGFTRVTRSSRRPMSTLLVAMAYRLLPIQPHVLTGSDEWRDEVREAMGAGVIRLWLLDRGVGAGERLGRGQSRGLDGLVPVKHHLAVLADRPGLANRPPAERLGPAARQRVKASRGQPLEDAR
jgi:hypothetical protein